MLSLIYAEYHVYALYAECRDAMLCLLLSNGLYYKHIMIIIDAGSVISK